MKWKCIYINSNIFYTTSNSEIFVTIKLLIKKNKFFNYKLSFPPGETNHERNDN